MDKNLRFYWEDGKKTGKLKENRIEVPGFRKGEIAAFLKGDTLSITATKKSGSVSKGKGFYREESSARSFSKSITVPGLGSKGLEVSVEDGAVVLKKKKKLEPRAQGSS